MNSIRQDAIPVQSYFASVARKRMAAGALCRDHTGQVLLVKPSYRDTWDTPGGVVEAEESPHAACRREVEEEISLDRPVGRVLAVDWVPPQGQHTEELILIYDGGVLAATDIAAIACPEDEIEAFAFFSPDEVSAHVRPVVSRRIQACLSALAAGTVAALEDGSPIYSLSSV
jgi:8-oxo-dGTP diphosphatase